MRAPSTISSLRYKSIKSVLAEPIQLTRRIRMWLDVVDCNSADEFIANLRLTHPRWKSDTLEHEWLFRGMGDATWKLRPSAWRSAIHPKIREFISSSKEFENIMYKWGSSQPPMDLSPEQRETWNNLSEQTRRDRSLAFVSQQYFELHLLYDFWQIANEVGHQVDAPYWVANHPIRWSDLVPPSIGMRDKFFKTILSATAQHHGIPTRLLDWTFLPSIAAFFAAQNPSGSRIAVWALKRSAVASSRLNLFQVPRASLPFLHAQSGLFIIDDWPYADFALTGEWPSHEDVLSDYCSRPDACVALRGNVACKITLPASMAPSVTEILWHERISRAHLMPTLDCVSQTVLGAYEWRNPKSVFPRFW